MNPSVVSREKPQQAKRILEMFSQEPLQVLNPPQVRQIDDAVRCLGESGEVRLVKNKGQLRFISIVHDEERI